MDDLWRSRLRVDASTPPDPGRARRGTPSFVGLVTSTGTLAVGKFVTVAPVALLGTEADGSTGTSTAVGGSVIAYPVGPGAPTTGDLVVCRRVDYRWVFDEFTGAVFMPPTPGFALCCPSNPLPASVFMTFTFGSGTTRATYGGQFQDTPLTYMTTAPSYAGPYFGPADSYFSPILTEDDGVTQIFYTITCNGTTTGSFSFGVGFVATGARAALCQIFSSFSCSPFLLNGATAGTPCALTTGFGTHAGDNMTAS
jgi:hypothetical protein